MEASALHAPSGLGRITAHGPLLRLRSDDQLVALFRMGYDDAFRAIHDRYRQRLFAYTRQMLGGSRSDAEDALQDVFLRAYGALRNDDRPVTLRAWLYRVAHNRCVDHLRRPVPPDAEVYELSRTPQRDPVDETQRREGLRQLVQDVQRLPEHQRSALLMRELEGLSYAELADALRTSVPAVKSLLVRARISLAEAAEARKLSCAEVRLELGEVAEGLVRLSPLARRHVRDCDRCRSFKRQLKENNHVLAAILPVGPLLLVKQLLLAKLGSSASAGSAHVASGASATVGAGAAAGAAGGAGSGVLTLGGGALATKAVAGLAAAAIVSAGAVAANQTAPRHHRTAHARTAYAPAQRDPYEPVLAAQRAQPLSASAAKPSVIAAHHVRRPGNAAKLTPGGDTSPTVSVPSAAAAVPPAPALLPPARPSPEPATPLTQLTSESTQLPAAATAAPESSPAVTASPESTPPAQAGATGGVPSSSGPPPPAAAAASLEAAGASAEPASASSGPTSASSPAPSASSASAGPSPAAAAAPVSSQTAAPVAPSGPSVEPAAPARASAAPTSPDARPQPIAVRHSTARLKSTSGNAPSRRRAHRSLPSRS